MARYYTIGNFLRQTPNSLLASYFAKRDVQIDVDFTNLKEIDPKTFLHALEKLPDHVRKRIEAQFRDIFDMSCEKGFRAILDAIKERYGESVAAGIIATLSGLSGYARKTMTTYLDYRECWELATLFFHADTLSSYWRKRKNLGQQSPATDTSSINQLASSIKEYFHNAEGRGKNCMVEVYTRGNLYYFFAYPEDFSQEFVEWVDENFERRSHNPAFEVIFIYSPQHGTLDINFNGSYKVVEQLQIIFSKTILKKDSLPPALDDNRVYDLNILTDKDFIFDYDRIDGISEVKVRELRLSSRTFKGRSIKIKADTISDPNGIYTQIEELSKTSTYRCANVTQVEITAKITTNMKKQPKQVSVRITYPNSCTLKYDETDLRIRKMLIKSGIEPKESLGLQESLIVNEEELVLVG